MKDFNKLEKHFNNLAEGQESTPPPFIWDNVEKQLPKKEKSKRRFLFWISPIVLLSGIGLYYFSSGDNLAQNKSLIVVETSEVINNEKSIATKATPIESLENVNSNPSNGQIEELKETNSNSLEKQETKALDQKAINANKLAIEKANASKFKLNNNQRLPRPTKNIKTKNTTVEKANEATLELLKTIGQPSESSVEAITKSKDDIQKSSSARKMNSSLLDEIKRLLLLPIDALEKVKPKSLALDYEDKKKMELAIDDNSVKKFFVELGTLVGIHNTHLDTSLNAANDTSGIYRISTESNWYTWGVKANLGYQISNKVYLKSGFSFMESKDKFSFRRDTVRLIDSLVTNGSYSTSTSSYFNVGDITYRQFNIPLTIGGNLDHGKFKFGVEASAIFNFKFASEGKVQLDNMYFSRVENENIYKNKLGIGYSLALFAGIDFNESSSVFIKPTFSNYLSNTNNATHSVHSRLSQIYLEMTYRYSF